MGMMAAKHTDLVVGMDMHMIQPPPPAPPVMVPHPVAGMIMDPADYSPGACTVFINGLPRARAGTMCMMCPPHIPIGGMFVKPPLSEAEVYQGSSTVTADGEAMSAMSHQVLGCHDIGAPAPVRKWKSGGAKSLMKAGSVVIAIPAGAPVFVGGSPTTSAEREIEDRAPGEWLQLEFVHHEDGTPFLGASYEIELADGSTRAGAVGDEGMAVLYGLPPGTCKVMIRGAIDAVSTTTATVVAADSSIRHRVAAHEDVLNIASAYGIGAKWRDVFAHADNASLQESRPDPFELEVGDLLVLPADLLERFEMPTSSGHAFRITPTRRRARFHLRRPTGAPFASCAWRASFGITYEELRGTTDDDGLVELDVPSDVRRISVLVEARRTANGEVLWQSFVLSLASLGSSTTTKGLAGRAQNLGVRSWNAEVAISRALKFACGTLNAADLDVAVRTRG